MLMNRAIHDLDRLREQYAKAQDAVNGRVLTRASEDPKRVEEAMSLSGAQTRLERVLRAGEDAVNWLQVSESHLSTMIDRLQAAREAVVQSGGPVGLDPDGQKSLRDTLQAIRDSLMQELNAQHQGLYLFGGYQTQTQPFDESSGTLVYQGDGNELLRTVAPGYTVGVTVPGDKLGAEAFIGALDQMIADLDAGNLDNLSSVGLPALDQAISNLTVLRSDLGLRQNQVTQYTEQAQDSILLIKERLTKISGGDLETAVLDMVEAQTAYMAALASFAKALPQSLIDYMLA